MRRAFLTATVLFVVGFGAWMVWQGPAKPSTRSDDRLPTAAEVQPQVRGAQVLGVYDWKPLADATASDDARQLDDVCGDKGDVGWVELVTVDQVVYWATVGRCGS